MRLNELLSFDDIVIQCHDNPDADALSSGFAVYWYLQKNGKKPLFIYRGINKISKMNLCYMLEKLDIPVSYEPEYDGNPSLMIMVDCQPGQKNVTTSKAENYAVIDHHQVTVKLPELCEVRSNIGSCATIIWDMLRDEGIDVNDNRDLATAMYYGLYTDTNRFSEIAHPLDKDMRDELDVNKSIVTLMSNSNVSLDELKIMGKAILGYQYHADNRFLVINADYCDPTILAVISDFSMETIDVDVCISFYASPQEVKFSVRSCSKEVHANELAAFIANGVGGGGGHIRKAGGVIRPELIPGLAGDDKETEKSEHESNNKTLANVRAIEAAAKELIVSRVNEYNDKYEIMYAKDTILDTDSMKKYEKRDQMVGCVRLTDVFPANTMIEIRTLEGDININVEDDKYLMIGIEGEVYPISKEKLEKSYKPAEEKYTACFEYEPSIKDVITDEKKGVLQYAKGVINTGKTTIFAKPLDKYLKLFTAWDDEKYYSGKPGDYIAVRDDDPHDIYVISGHLFDRLYREV